MTLARAEADVEAGATDASPTIGTFRASLGAIRRSVDANSIVASRIGDGFLYTQAVVSAIGGVVREIPFGREAEAACFPWIYNGSLLHRDVSARE